jgi:hypothetical protein
MWVVSQLAPQQAGVAHSQPSRSGAVPLLQSDAPALHVYEHAVPLQLSADALVAVHESPHALQLLVVLSSVQVPPHVDSPQVHAPPEQNGVGWAHVVWFVHVPVPLHVCVVLLLQLVCPGAHTPLQTPAEHVWFVHVAGLPHEPVAVHVSEALPGTHWVSLGPQTPPQEPFKHVRVAAHATGVPHAPPALHVCTPFAEHSVAPGTHDPPQAPPTHALLMQAAGAPHCPTALHSSTPLLKHRVWPGPQTPPQKPPEHVRLLPQSLGAPQVPVALHVCAALPRHWVAPGVHATQVLFRQDAVGLAQVSTVAHVPVPSHDWIRLPRHRVAPDVHEPEHWPVVLMHVWPELAQDVPLVQPPLALQVCGISPLQRTWFGAHEPVQLAPMHVWLVHAAGVLH